MKRLLIFALLFVTLVTQQGSYYYAAASAGSSYLVEENFDGTGEPATWGHFGTVNYDYTTTVLEGTQSWQATDGGTNLSYLPFTAQSSVDVYVRFRASTVSGGRPVLELDDGNPTSMLKVTMDGNFVLWDTADTHFAQPVTATSANTTYHMWIGYTKGSGSNAVLTVGFSTTGVRPTSGNSFMTITNGSSTADVSFLLLFGGLSGGSHIFDRVIVKAGAGTIGDNP